MSDRYGEATARYQARGATSADAAYSARAARRMERLDGIRDAKARDVARQEARRDKNRMRGAF